MAKKKTTKKNVKKAGKKSTALARRRSAVPKATQTGMALRLRDPQGLLPGGSSEGLTDSVVLGNFALVEVKLTQKEELVLSKPVDVGQLMIKPTGQVYLPHAFYRRWFNDAFGRLGWFLRPVNNPVMAPAKNDKAVQVVRGYLLYIHNKPAAYADGEHEFYTNNAEQSWGDALEATQASALRRCAKHMGVGLELWDRHFTERFKQEHCVMSFVKVKDRNGNTHSKPHWRLKTDPPPANVIDERDYAARNEPFEGEVIDHGAPAASRPARRQPPPTASADGSGALFISPKQTTRLFGASKSAGRDRGELLRWLKDVYGAEVRGERPDDYLTLPREEYERVFDIVGAPGELPQGRA